MRDSTVSIAISMSLIYMIVALFAGGDYIKENLSGGTNSMIYALTLGGTFAAGVLLSYLVYA